MHINGCKPIYLQKRELEENFSVIIYKCETVYVNIVTKFLEKSPIMTLKKEGLLAVGLASVKLPISPQKNCY